MVNGVYPLFLAKRDRILETHSVYGCLAGWTFAIFDPIFRDRKAGPFDQ